MQNICRITTFVVLCLCPARILALEHRTDWTCIAEMLGDQKSVGPYSKLKHGPIYSSGRWMHQMCHWLLRAGKGGRSLCRWGSWCDQTVNSESGAFQGHKLGMKKGECRHQCLVIKFRDVMSCQSQVHMCYDALLFLVANNFLFLFMYFPGSQMTFLVRIHLTNFSKVCTLSVTSSGNG